ncbi:MAG: hypothetical protein ACR2HE_08195 [Casimicrobiaceae bacterium]
MGKPNVKEEASPLPESADRSHEDLNPILWYHDDGTIDAEETLDNLGDLSDFLANLECVELPFEHKAFGSGLFLIHRTMLAAIRELGAQFAAVREAKH